jgi:hypothetical protein
MRARTPSIPATGPTPTAALARRTCPPGPRVPARNAPRRRAPDTRRGRPGRGRATKAPLPARGSVRKTPCPAAVPGRARRAAALGRKARPASARPERKTLSVQTEDGFRRAAAPYPRAALARADSTAPRQEGRISSARLQDSPLAGQAGQVGQAPGTDKARRDRDSPTDPTDRNPVPAGNTTSQGSQALTSTDRGSPVQDRRDRGRTDRNDSGRGSAVKASTGRRPIPT